MQQTNFPFVAVIVDDASTDGEQEVIRKYVDEHFDHSQESDFKEWETEDAFWTFAQHIENRNCHFVVIYLKKNLYGNPKKKEIIKPYLQSKYIAICEGDDYWTDPMKLQKQVDFLEEHPDYSLCCHGYDIYNQNEGTWDDNYAKKLFKEVPDGFSFGNRENLSRWFARTLTLVFRRDCYDNNELKKYKYRCDVHNCYLMLKKSKGFCLPFVGGVYRICDSGIFSGLTEKERLVRWCLIRAELLNYNLEDKDLRDNVYLIARRFLYEHKICKEMFGVVIVCLRSFYKTEGLRAAMRAAKKIAGSYYYGLNAKRSKRSNRIECV